MYRSIAFGLSLLALPAAAEPSRTILVLDASGSMWGQIDGEPKIAIARRAVGELLDTLPATAELGLSAYGHRRKGDCGDIETLVPVGARSRPAIRAAVEAIRPKGKTPLSDAVRAAAEALKYSEEKATVILLSDGRETCEADPCAVGRLLEETGVDFTAHVVGFDITEAEDEAQLRCLAENTGGDFVLASDATELREALERVTAPPAPVEIAFGASERGKAVTDDLIWTVTPEEGDAVLDYEAAAAPALPLDPGTYTVEVLRTSDEAFASAMITVGPGEPVRHVLPLEVPMPKATLDAPGTVAAGAALDVGWTGPGAPNDSLQITREGVSRPATQASTGNGNPATLTAPAEAGDYVLSYFFHEGRAVLVTVPLTVEKAGVTLSAPETAAGGSRIAVEWSGPDAPYDSIQIATAKGTVAQSVGTAKGSPAMLTVPAAAGEYVLRYHSHQGRAALASVPLTVGEAEVTLSVPDSVAAGSRVSVEWTGPDAPYDSVRIATAKGATIRTVGTAKGSPAMLTAPAEPGGYVLRYHSHQGRATLASVPLTVGEAQITLSPPAVVAAGAPFALDWEGPDAPYDRIEIVPTGGGKPTASIPSTRGSPATLKAPDAPGDYVLRYRSHEAKAVLGTAALSVVAPEAMPKPEAIREPATPAPATPEPATPAAAEPAAPAPAPVPIEAPEVEAKGQTEAASDTGVTLELLNAPVTVGATALVLWTGPGGEDDGIVLAPVGSGDDAALAFAPLAEGNPVPVPMPSRTGGYELRYMDGDGAILSRVTFTLQSEPN